MQRERVRIKRAIGRETAGAEPRRRRRRPSARIRGALKRDRSASRLRFATRANRRARVPAFDRGLVFIPADGSSALLQRES